jgi:hypothetical protein
MSVLKWKDANGKWVAIYANFLRDCLRKSNNLSDILDKVAARRNLGVDGDNVTSHYHDSRYLPLIEEAKAAVGFGQNITNAIEKEKTERKAADDEIRNDIDTFKKDFNAGMDNLIVIVNNTFDTKSKELDTKLDQLKNKINETIGKIDLQYSNVDINTDFAGRNNLGDNTNKPSKENWIKILYWYEDDGIERVIGNGQYTLSQILNLLVKHAHRHTYQDRIREAEYWYK